MRVFLARLAALLVLAAGVLAWDKNDYEIFDLVSALKADGDASFYSFLNIEPSATQSEITKAYRKRSLELHPDKNPGVAGIQDRFARLGVITAILRDGERRDRYNFFLKNGVPTWKGLGYAYSRWRPGLGLVMSFLVLLTAGMHYIVMRMNHRRDTARVAYFTAAAQKVARGANGRRKVRVPMSEGGHEMLELIVEDGEVYLPHDDGSVTSLDELAPQPSIARTWPVALVRSVVGRVTGTKEVHVEAHASDSEVLDEDDVDEVEGFAVDTPRGSRAAQLRAQRQKKTKASRESSAAASATNTEGEGEDEDTAGTGTEPEADGKPRRRGPGKANAARRRKMGMKK